MSDWQDISDILTARGTKRLKVGQVLVLDYEGSRNEYKVMRKRRGKVWVKPARLYLPEEIDIVDKEEA